MAEKMRQNKLEYNPSIGAVFAIVMIVVGSLLLLSDDSNTYGKIDTVPKGTFVFVKSVAPGDCAKCLASFGELVRWVRYELKVPAIGVVVVEAERPSEMKYVVDNYPHFDKYLSWSAFEREFSDTLNPSANVLVFDDDKRCIGSIRAEQLFTDFRTPITHLLNAR